MKNNDLQDLTPVYVRQTDYSTDDEISLVDLARALARRKKMIAIISTLIIALGVLAALLTPKSYTYSTSIEIGSQLVDSAIKPFSSPETLLAKIQHAFIPRVLNEQQQVDPEGKKIYTIKTSVPKNSTIIILEIKGTEDESGLITNLLQQVTQQAIEDHRRIYNAVKTNLNALIQQSKAELAAIDSENINLMDKKRHLKSRIESHQAALVNLQNTREISPPTKSIKPSGTSKKLIVSIAIFGGIFLAVFSAFFAEFIAKVKEQTQDES